MDLDPANAGINPDEKRKRYIEKMTRRHMQTQRRLKLTRRGEVIGGEYWDGVAAATEGSGRERRRGLEEVRTLEAIYGVRAAGGEDGGEDGEERL